VGSLPVLWFDHARLARDRPSAPHGLTFVEYLRCTFRLPPAASLPVEMARLGARLRRTLSGDTEERRARGTAG
jgi:hypothetical protein